MPFKESAREKKPLVPVLSNERVLCEYTPIDPRANGQFFTPPEMAAQVVKTIEAQHPYKLGFKVLEPCAGIGNLVAPLLAQGWDWDVTAYEIDPYLVHIGQKLFGARVNYHLADVFMLFPALNRMFDVVLLNAPFNIPLNSRAADELSTGGSGVKKSEHQFLQAAVNALKSGGYIYAIGPYNMYTGLPVKAKGWFADRVELLGATPLPGRFKNATIGVHLFVFRKK